MLAREETIPLVVMAIVTSAMLVEYWLSVDRSPILGGKCSVDYIYRFNARLDTFFFFIDLLVMSWSKIESFRGIVLVKKTHVPNTMGVLVFIHQPTTIVLFHGW